MQSLSRRPFLYLGTAAGFAGISGCDGIGHSIEPDTRFARGPFDAVGPYFMKTPAEGAATQVYVAAQPTVAGVSGAYFDDCNPVIVSGDS